MANWNLRARIGAALCSASRAGPRGVPTALMPEMAALLLDLACSVDHVAPPPALLALLAHLGGADLDGWILLFSPTAHKCNGDDCEDDDDLGVCSLRSQSFVRSEYERNVRRSLEAARAAPPPDLNAAAPRTAAALADLLRAACGLAFNRPDDQRDMLSLIWLLIFFALRLPSKNATVLLAWASGVRGGLALEMRTLRGLSDLVLLNDDGDVDPLGLQCRLAEAARVVVCSIAGAAPVADLTAGYIALTTSQAPKRPVLLALAKAMTPTLAGDLVLMTKALEFALAFEDNSYGQSIWDAAGPCFINALCALGQMPADAPADAPPAKRARSLDQ